MAGQIKPVHAQQTIDGQVVGTFQLVRPGREIVQFNLTVPGDANQDQIGQLLLQKVQAIATHEPAPALGLLEGLVAAGQSWAVPDVAAQ